jgi:hypothetical protein
MYVFIVIYVLDALHLQHQNDFEALEELREENFYLKQAKQRMLKNMHTKPHQR